MFQINTINISRLIISVFMLIMLTACGGGGDGGQTTLFETDNGIIEVDTPPPTASSRTVTLNWVAPTSYVDDAPLSLSGHIIYIDDGSGYRVLQTIRNPGVNTYLVENLDAGIYRFRISAFDDFGVESDLSNEAIIVVS
ncbi:MAG: fibronectin type III domain-containing protein [Gammaproteobacteria bacterium]|nr:fibronectin type III domain-containing protein [Gammaproteobacteria bacterium]